MPLYSVRTKGYKTYYVWADDYQSAAVKAEKHICELAAKCAIGYDGSLLIPNEDDDKIVGVELIAEKIIK